MPDILNFTKNLKSKQEIIYAMSTILSEHIKKFIHAKESDMASVVPFFKSRELKKKENVLEEGEVCDSNYFVTKGCMRMFFVNDKGVEQTIQFALENWWISDYMSFQHQRPSGFYIQAVEKTELLSITYTDQEKMLVQFPFMERYFRLVHQRAYAASLIRIRGLYDQSKEEIYRNFSKRYPEFVQRVPQYLLASFLGLTPEYLSEIRGKKLS